METITVVITKLSGAVFPGLIIGGVLIDSRTGEDCKCADKWEKISFFTHEMLCLAQGLE